MCVCVFYTIYMLILCLHTIYNIENISLYTVGVWYATVLDIKTLAIASGGVRTLPCPWLHTWVCYLLWPMKGESHEEILSSTLVSGSKFWGAFHMVLAGPPKQWDPIPTMIVSSTTLFLLLSCFALCIPNKILLEGYFPGKTQVKGTFYCINIGTQISLYPIKIFLKIFLV